MHPRSVILTLFTFCMLSAYGQSTVPVDVVQLSQVTLEKSPLVKRNLLIINNAEGALQVQRSAFDYLLFSGFSTGRSELNLYDEDFRRQFVDGGLLNSRSTSASLGLQKAFRSSLRMDLSVSYALSNDNSILNRFNRTTGEFIGDHTMSSAFSLTQPLMRGRGRIIATALEEASKLSLESSNDNAVFANSFELLQTGSTYWQYVAAFKRLKIFQENEARVRRVLEVTEELVKADKRPAGDLSQVKADLANQERQTKAAEQALFSARLNLGRAVGLSEDDSKLLGDPIDEFPTIAESGYLSSINESAFVELARKNRKDIEAAKKVQESLELRLRLAENDKKAQVDLTGFVNYGGNTIGNGFGTAFSTFSQADGRNFGYGVSLNFSFPVNNNRAQGAYVQNQTALKDQEIANSNLQRNIDLNVSIALNNLSNSIQVLEKAKESLDFYQEVYNNEQIKFKNGLTILLNLIQFQERLTFAELEYLSAKQQFAVAIINLRYETGTLLAGQGSSSINKSLFYTIPL